MFYVKFPLVKQLESKFWRKGRRLTSCCKSQSFEGKREIY